MDDYMDDYECMDGKSLMKQHYLEKKNFNATSIWKMLQMQITCMHKWVCKDFGIKNFYLKGDTLFLADLFENVRQYVFKNLLFRS